MDFVPLCTAWPYDLTCDLSGASPTVTGAALQAASEYYWAKSGHQYGSCTVTIRPCKPGCVNTSAWPYWSGDSWPAWMGPSHAGFSVGWLCNRCGGGCSCNNADEILLPVHAQSITQVVVDGIALTTNAYVLHDGYRLVRADGGLWPACQDWTIPVTGTGAWSVKAVFGWPVPALGELAVGELLCEFVKAIEPAVGDCKLPSNVVRIVRANTTYEFGSPSELAGLDLTGLPIGDRFLDSVNPMARNESGQAMTRLRLPSRIWNPDDF